MKSKMSKKVTQGEKKKVFGIEERIKRNIAKKERKYEREVIEKVSKAET